MEVKAVSPRDAMIQEEANRRISFVPTIGDGGGTMDITVKDGMTSTQTMGHVEVKQSHGVLRPESRVFVGRTEMTAEQAYLNGFLHKDSHGNYFKPATAQSDTDQEVDSTGPSSATPDDDTSPEYDQTLMADPNTEAYLEQMSQNAGSQNAMDMAVLKALQIGHDEDAECKLLGTEDVESAKAVVELTYDGLYIAAVNHVKSKVHDVDPHEAFEWASENVDQTEIMDAQFMWYKGDSSGLLKIVERYKKRLN